MEPTLLPTLTPWLAVVTLPLPDLIDYRCLLTPADGIGAADHTEAARHYKLVTFLLVFLLALSLLSSVLMLEKHKLIYTIK